MMKPIRIVFFGLSVFLFFGVVSYAFRGVEWKVMGISFKFPSLSSFWTNSKPRYKNISHIIKLSTELTDTLKLSIAADTLKKNPEKPKASKYLSNVNTDSVRGICRYIEFPPNRDTLFFAFFDELGSLTDSEKLIRILHYGDSQIEGDRITSYVRNQLQAKFGGCGIGLFPVIASNPASVPYLYTVSDNWKRYSPLPGYKEYTNRRYGPLVNLATLLPNVQKTYMGWIELKYPVTSYLRAQNSQQFRVFYGFNQAPVMVEVKHKEEILDAEILPASSSLQVLKWDMASPRDIIVSFKTDSPPEIYGLALDGKNGIAIDNIPLRGSSGVEFTKIDLAFLKEFYRVLNVKMLILQFGANVVPNVTSNYQYYEKAFYRQLLTLKQTVANLPILVIGVGDVSRNAENGYESVPNVEMIRDAQRKAAFAAGCAFWDMYEAMGGHNSMPSWVLANPPLAQKDFVHLNPLGAKIIGEMFYRSFMHEYDRYLECRAQPKI